MTEARGFADVDYDEAMRRARALVPVLRERADAAEVGRQMQKETLDDLHRTGLLRFHQPRRWGGMELPFVALFDVPAEISRGCASTGWNVANLGVHHWMLALYDERAQEDVWGPNPDVVIPSGIAYPQGRGRRVDGGFLISGFWNFSSGVDHGDWNMLAVMVRDGERVVDHRMCLVPKSDYEIVDDWHTLGMRSTGSKSVRATAALGRLRTRSACTWGGHRATALRPPQLRARQRRFLRRHRRGPRRLHPLRPLHSRL